MNAIKILSIFVIIKGSFCQDYSSFIGKMVCVFTADSNKQASNIYECATLCASNNCQVFYHDDLTNICSFYPIQQTCQSQNVCKFVKAFFNNKYNDNFTDGHSSARYQILKDINITIITSNVYSTVFMIINAAQTEPVFLGTGNEVHIGFGRYNNSGMIIWLFEQLIIDMNNKMSSAQLIGNNLVKYLTSGKCIWYYNCYHSIDDYNNYIGVPNLVFGIIHTSIFDFQDLKNKSMSYRWHFILALTYNLAVTSSIKSLLNVYGFCAAIGLGFRHSQIDENICQPTKTPANSYTCQ